MGRLYDQYDQIRSAIEDGRYLISLHADERCEERGITAWQLVAAFDEAKLIRELLASHPHPSVEVSQILVDGTEVEAIWLWLGQSRWAELFTVYDRSEEPWTMRDRLETRKRWVQRGRFAVEVDIEVVVYDCLEPDTVRKLDEIARRAEQGDVAYLQTVSRVFEAVAP